MNRETDEIQDCENRMDVEQAISRLTPQQGRAVRLYMAGYTQAEIARKFGVSQQAISKMMKVVVVKCALFYTLS